MVAILKPGNGQQVPIHRLISNLPPVLHLFSPIPKSCSNSEVPQRSSSCSKACLLAIIMTTLHHSLTGGHILNFTIQSLPLAPPVHSDASPPNMGHHHHHHLLLITKRHSSVRHASMMMMMIISRRGQRHTRLNQDRVQASPLPRYETGPYMKIYPQTVDSCLTIHPWAGWWWVTARTGRYRLDFSRKSLISNLNRSRFDRRPCLQWRAHRMMTMGRVGALWYPLLLHSSPWQVD